MCECLVLGVFWESAAPVCVPLMLLLSHFLFGSSVADSARDGLKIIFPATISSVLNILPPEDSLINRFFTPSTSLIPLVDPNVSCRLRSITAGIHSENI